MLHTYPSQRLALMLLQRPLPLSTGAIVVLHQRLVVYLPIYELVPLTCCRYRRIAPSWGKNAFFSLSSWTGTRDAACQSIGAKTDPAINCLIDCYRLACLFRETAPVLPLLLFYRKSLRNLFRECSRKARLTKQGRRHEVSRVCVYLKQKGKLCTPPRNGKSNFLLVLTLYLGWWRFLLLLISLKCLCG